MIGTYAASSPVLAIAFRSGYAYCAMGTGGLLIVDVHDPRKPAVTVRTIADVNGVDIEGDYLFIAHGSGNPSMSAYTLVEPVSPLRVSTYNAGPVSAFVSGGAAGIGITGTNRLTSFGYSDSSGFTKLSDLTLTRSSTLKTVHLRGQYALAASGADGWAAVGISGSGGLVDMGSMISGGATSRAILMAGQVYAADGTAGLRVYEVDSLNTLQPTVAITSPATGETVASGSEAEVRAEVTNGDNAAVTFSVNGSKVFTDEAAPYSYRFRVPVNAGTLTIKARAYNLNGLFADSSEVVLTVGNETVPPTITITSPEPGTTPTLFEGETFHMKGTAQDNYGVARVDLFVDGTLADSTILPSFDLAYAIPNDGMKGTDYLLSLLVRATDVSGNSAETNFSIHVTEDNPPTVAFITPQPGAAVYRGTTISPSVTAVDDRAVKEVRFYEGTTLLGTGTPSGNMYSIAYKVPDVAQIETRTLRAEAVDIIGQTAVAETSIVITAAEAKVVTSVGTDAVTIDAQGDIAVTGGSAGVLRIYNIGVPTAPVLLGSLNTGYGINQVRIVGSRVYGAVSGNMFIIDIADPAHPVVLKALYPGCPVNSVDAYDDVAVVGMSCNSIYVYDVRNGQSPVVKSSISLAGGSVMDVRIDGLAGRLYAVVDNGSNSYLSVMDTGNMSTLLEIGRVKVPGTPRRLEVAGDKVYIANNIGMVVVDVKNPAMPSVIGSIDTPGTGTGLRVLGNLAFVADGETYGLSVVNVTEPTLPAHVMSVDTPGSAKEVALANGLAFLADGAAGMTIVDPGLGNTPPSLKVALVHMEVDSGATTVAVIGSVGAVSDDTFPVLVRVKSTSTGQVYETQVTAADRGAFRVTLPWNIGDEFTISLVESTGNPVTLGPYSLGVVPAGDVVGNVPLSGYTQTVDVSGDIAVTGASDGTLSVFDMTNPLSPSKLGSLGLGVGEGIWQVRIVGSRVYAAIYTRMKIIDIANPSNPVQLSATNEMGGRPYAYTIDVYGDIAFVGSSDYGYIYIYDVRNGQSPVQKSYKSIGSGSVRDVRVDGLAGRLYAVVDNGSSSYLSVFDTRDIFNLVEIGKVAVPGTPRRLEVIGDKVYIAAKAGVVVVSLGRLGTADFGKDGNGDGWADDILSYTATSGGAANDVDVLGNYAYVADSLANGMFNSVKVMDITDPVAPIDVGEIISRGDGVVELKMVNGYLYVADGDAGLSILEPHKKGWTE